MVWRICAILLLTVSIACGQGAQGVLRKGEALGLTDLQEKQIREILNKTVTEYNDLRTREQGSPGLSEKLNSLRKGAEDKSLDLLTLEQRKRWDELSGNSARPPDAGSSTSQPAMDGSLLIPTIEELRNPPRPGAYGPSTTLAKTVPHPVSSQGYLILTDHTDPAAGLALKELARVRGGELMVLKDLGTLYENPLSAKQVRNAIRKVNPRFVAIAPRMESFRENMHLCLLKILSGLDDDPELDVFPGYLLASGPEELAALVNRSIQYRSLDAREIAPASIGAIEDSDARRYRSYQKAKVMQKMFADKGKESPAIIVTTKKSHTERDDYPELPASEGNIIMSPTSERHTFESLPLSVELAIDKSNMLFMFGHGTTSRICGIDIDVFAKTDFTDGIIFCGSCMSAAPYDADRVDLASKRNDKRFAFYAMDNGAVMMLGHMGLCGGFPKVFPMAEQVLAGTSTGEAYQQLMNSIIGDNLVFDYYEDYADSKGPANAYLYVLLGDPALVPVKK